MTILSKKEYFYGSCKANKFDRLSQKTTLVALQMVATLLKDSFKDILQELMEVELDATLCYEKIIRRSAGQTTKSKMVIPQRT